MTYIKKLYPMDHSQSIKKTNYTEDIIYFLMTFFYFNIFFAPVFRKENAPCPVNLEHLGIYNNFIFQIALYLKLIILQPEV